MGWALAHHALNTGPGPRYSKRALVPHLPSSQSRVHRCTQAALASARSAAQYVVSHPWRDASCPVTTRWYRRRSSMLIGLAPSSR